MTGLTPHYTAKVLRGLAARGSATVTGATLDRLYTATDKYPLDLRGKHPEIAVNFVKGRVMGLQAIAAKRGKLYVPRPVHPLDCAMRKAS